MQAFKETDEKEARMAAVGTPLFELLSSDRTEFYENVYQCYELGDVFVNLNNSPLARAIPPEAFRKAFYAIHQLFTRPGTFEFYISVFQAIFGEEVDIQFVIPSPGHLEINIETLNELLEPFSARDIVNNAYVYEEVVTDDAENILFQGKQGIKTQDEVNKLMKELQPAGLFIEATLTIT